MLIAVSSQDHKVYLDKQTKYYDLIFFSNCAISYNLEITTEIQVFREKKIQWTSFLDTKKYELHI